MFCIRIGQLALALILCSCIAHGFVAPTTKSFQRMPIMALNSETTATDDGFQEIELKIPPSNSGLFAQMKIEKLLKGVNSEIIEVRYSLPFGLDVEPKAGRIVCTKDGAGGEKVGDILRYTSAWSMGLPRGDGLITTAASFAGGLSWQCNMVDVMKCESWQQVIEALTSNVESRTDEVVLLFEREIS